MSTYLYQVAVDSNGGYYASRCNADDVESKVKTKRFPTRTAADAWVAKDKDKLRAIFYAGGRPEPKTFDF